MRSTLLYLLMVGVPLLGLLAILRAGEGLVAPPFVGGDWLVQAESGGPALVSCFTDDEPVVLSVSQSGARAELTLHQGARRVRMDAVIVDDALRAVRTPTPAPAGCDSLQLWATIAHDSLALGLSGAIQTDCRSNHCRAAQEFVATRRSVVQTTR